MTFDYPHQRILLEPNSHFPEPFRANESGLSLLAKGEDFHHFEADDVEKDSPAESGGVEKGEVLIAVNGSSASALDLEQIDQILQQAGQAIPITIERNGKTLKLVLRLKERI